MNSEIERFLSVSRLAKYYRSGETPEQGFARYQWNVQLAEALLPSLNYFEVGLRNGIDHAISAIYYKDWLLKLPSGLKITTEDERKIGEFAREHQTDKGWAARHDDILAKLGFGFWAAFFHNRYDPILWQRPDALKTVFPHMQRTLRTRKYISPKIHQIRTLRNRIAHHEPIWHMADVQSTYQTISELVLAMSTAAAQELVKIDRFPSIYQAGVAAQLTR